MSDWQQGKYESIAETGYMTNPDEDAPMATDEYRYQIADGIANGIGKFIEATCSLHF
ncbi:MAG: N-acetylmuramoyl-L-alanine amidase [Lachnospiraceae bacterium]|nr:N-acetylmuramoyl-L-alanine amidase [Lachnospiraceae bacterium]